jgi:hypothetical protein
MNSHACHVVAQREARRHRENRGYEMMKRALGYLLLSVLATSCGAYAAEQGAPKREAEVQKDINSIVATCEKKKLPAEQEIECIEQAFLEFMEEMAQQRAAALR